MTLPSYLTVGGALVALARTGGQYPEAITSTCGGCGDTDQFNPADSLYLKDPGQAHAEVCRAVPRLPNGVIARAKTLGGGHIDITTQETPDGITATANCAGCPETFSALRNWPYLKTPEERREQAIHDAREWAREHATCPFIPSGAA